jgi:ribulose-5-phosphate 4-epimerase/fuculose-1-phosphate aldolase
MPSIDQEAQAREKLAACARALGRLGGLGVGGHVSLRVPDGDLILITPGGGLDKEKLTAEDMVTMDAAGAYVAGPYRPPLEWPIHTAVHAARPELDSVAHLHAHWSTVFAISEVPMEPIILGAAARIGERLPYFEVPELVTTPDLGEKLNTALGSANAVLMRWHGSTVVGNTLEEMFDRAWAIEENARLFWEASLMGKLVPLPPGVAQARAASPSPARALNYYLNLERPKETQIHQAPPNVGR